jgi:hypothetical protein
LALAKLALAKFSGTECRDEVGAMARLVFLDRLKALASCQPVQANFVPIFAEMLLDRKTPEISEG